ncbi:MAG: type I glyceraldehyde-3-phosphate dehydrogenase [Candidatus Jacksonbacteria bacterium RIFOXYC2_FULL_44_29]|nr:MAG: Glyceraldehyde-3-phosphate dehydrogenase [Parcubacteria group bacterium GW2011_GWC2_44_22]OGY75743.1 MAG: type I glyceraldehyde-3-phosphate dehydrogenase [Candidatus Jacksonbacteria bacterium RIFOXYA2_FULL_43_12]OGY76309.1 MAG: type I glyceraldehyde-3-phosphate dehydrogenase [Candidatus Jacksonbacteria bacterium RIFOXYB2_FULL_44_15]OGY78136.1 MAG: type I glyceraldehyde-3-phosphate dehydrogenase [Candidatus Jacksonbacteria bacterium RIFOXYC2_FULL_44_29]OGY80956.1 MAG: type I glyceraldehy
MKKIAINGFGRIGRAAFKIALQHQDELEVVAINDLFPTKTLAYLLKYDSVYGTYEKEVQATENAIVVAGKSYSVFAEKEPNKLPWGKLGVDTVIESTGIFRTEETMRLHLQAGAKQVILSAPPKNEGSSGGISTCVLGVTDITADKNPLKSCASCTTNSIAPAVQVIHEALGIKKAILTTIHGYTADQSLVDGPHKDLRRGRAAAINIVPTSTGAALATAQVIPDLQGKFDGLALRVPVPVGSISDVTMLVSKKTTVAEVNQILKNAAASARYQGIIGVTDEPLVSTDIHRTAYSGIIDLALTKVIDGDLVKIMSWYDNEWGYTNRLVELVIKSS